MKKKEVWFKLRLCFLLVGRINLEHNGALPTPAAFRMPPKSHSATSQPNPQPLPPFYSFLFSLLTHALHFSPSRSYNFLISCDLSLSLPIFLGFCAFLYVFFALNPPIYNVISNLHLFPESCKHYLYSISV